MRWDMGSSDCLCFQLQDGMLWDLCGYVSELEAAKKSLSEALGENVKQYWANLKLWFKQKISKEEFDLEARRLLTQDNGNGAAAGGRAALRGLVWAARLAPLGAALPVWGERLPDSSER